MGARDPLCHLSFLAAVQRWHLGDSGAGVHGSPAWLALLFVPIGQLGACGGIWCPKKRIAAAVKAALGPDAWDSAAAGGPLSTPGRALLCWRRRRYWTPASFSRCPGRGRRVRLRSLGVDATGHGVPHSKGSRAGNPHPSGQEVQTESLFSIEDLRARREELEAAEAIRLKKAERARHDEHALEQPGKVTVGLELIERHVEVLAATQSPVVDATGND